MQYTKNTLLKDEKIIFNTSPHPIIFGTSIILYLVAILFYLNLYHMLDSTFVIFGKSINNWAAIIAFFFAIIMSLSALITYKTSEYAVTDKRVLMKTGLIQRYSLELFLDKIEAIYVDQTILGRILKLWNHYSCRHRWQQRPIHQCP